VNDAARRDRTTYPITAPCWPRARAASTLSLAQSFARRSVDLPSIHVPRRSSLVRARVRDHEATKRTQPRDRADDCEQPAVENAKGGSRIYSGNRPLTRRLAARCTNCTTMPPSPRASSRTMVRLADGAGLLTCHFTCRGGGVLGQCAGSGHRRPLGYESALNRACGCPVVEHPEPTHCGDVLARQSCKGCVQ
jgi:hypothetical protein